jgi:predicted GNAT family N-acyltransferase
MLNLQGGAQPRANGNEISDVRAEMDDVETISIRRLKPSEIDTVFEVTQRNLDVSIADKDAVRRVHLHNPDSFWGVYRNRRNDPEFNGLQGYYAFLLLNKRGDALLRNRTLDKKSPQVEFLAASGERPHSAYIWSMVVKGLSAIATPMVVKALGKTCAGTPLYASAATQGGLNLMRRQGFQAVTPADDGIGGLFLFGQLGDLKVRPLRARRLESRFKVIVARTSEDVEMALAIRAGVFMSEQSCPYNEEFDGNDRSATHLLAFVDDEPAATMRIRYFADFVKFERLAVLPRFRRTLIAKDVVQTGINFCQRKGYRKMYGHVQKRLANFWSRFGFKPIDKNYALVFSDREHIEMSGEIEPHHDPITIHSDPHIFLRPEGCWDERGVLEKSADRMPTNPN